MGDYTMKRERPTRFSNSYYNYKGNQYQHDSTKESKDSKNSSSKAVMSENEVSRAYLDTIKRLEDEIQNNDNEIKHLEDFNILAYDKIQLLTNELQQTKEENNALSNDLLDMYDYCDNQETYIKELQLKNKQLLKENEHLLNENEELRMQHIHNKWLSSSQQRDKQQRRRNRSSTSDIVEEKSPSSSIFAPASLLFPNNDDDDEEEEETFVDSKVLELQLYIEKQQKAAAIAKKQVEEKLKQQEEVIKCTQSCLDVERRKSKSLSQRLFTLQQDNNVSEEKQALDGTDENSNRVEGNNSNPWRRLSSITQTNKRLFSISNNYDSSSNNRGHHNEEEEEEEDSEPRLTLMSDPLSNKQQGFPLSRRRINNSRMLYYQDNKDEGSNSSSIQSIQKNVHGEGDRRRDTNDNYNTVSTLSPNNRMRRFPNVLSMLRGGGGVQQGHNHQRFSATTLSNDGILMKQNSDSSNISTVTDVTTTKEHNSMVSNCALSAATTIVVPSSSTEILEENEKEEPKDYKNSTTTTTRLTPSAVRKKIAVGERRQSSLQKTSNNETLTERCILSSSAA